MTQIAIGSRKPDTQCITRIMLLLITKKKLYLQRKFNAQNRMEHNDRIDHHGDNDHSGDGGQPAMVFGVLLDHHNHCSDIKQ